ncbi:MAG: glycoside hydrolase family 78 protein [bacterium]
MISVKSLRTEYLENPLGIDVTEPRFSWQLQSSDENARNQSQSAYQIIVASSKEKLSNDYGDFWDSGKVESAQMGQVVYAGKPLKSRDRCYWKVRVWNQNNVLSNWSEPALFSMGLLNPSDWTAHWIGAPPEQPYKDENGLPVPHSPDRPIPPSPLLRKSFEIKKRAKRALAYATSLGVYKLCINGKQIGNNLLAPEWTDYHKRIQYQTFDVTDLLTPGENTIGAMLGDGWYAGRLGPVRWDQDYPRRGGYGLNRRFLLQLEIEFEDGSKQTIASDGSWKILADGPIRSADNFLGEVYDLRKEQPGWDQLGYDDSHWQPVYVDQTKRAKLVAQMNEPVAVVKELRPITVTEPVPNIYIFDMGQNMVGWCKIRLSGPAGSIHHTPLTPLKGGINFSILANSPLDGKGDQVIPANSPLEGGQGGVKPLQTTTPNVRELHPVTLRHGEMLDPDGTLYTANLGSAKQTDIFIHVGNGAREFEPHFTYHGFRFVEVAGLQTKPSLDMLTGRVIASSTRQTGAFECSNPVLNKLFENIVWSQRGNMHSVPTDCPQRDERMGWLGDAQVFAQTAIFNMDMAAFFSKWLQDIRDAQTKDGRYPDFAPHPYNPEQNFSDAPGWADAGVIIPWRLYENYGDVRILESHYDSAARFIENIRVNNPHFIWANCTGNKYGDWLNGDTINIERYPKKGGSLPFEVFATAMWAQSTEIMAKMAGVLGKKIDARKYDEMLQNIRTVFLENFVSKNGRISGKTQAGYALALHLDLLPEALRPNAVQHLLKALEKYDWQLSTGFITTIMLMKVLTRFGHNELAYRLIESTRCPSWGYCIEQGATTLWERWDAYVAGRGIQDSDMNSFNHYAFGSVGEWMIRTILGINPDPENPGYEHVIIRPQPGGSLTWARGHYDSIRGRIAVAWRISGDCFDLDVDIPVNTTATVYLPASDVNSILEMGDRRENRKGSKKFIMKPGQQFAG